MPPKDREIHAIQEQEQAFIRWTSLCFRKEAYGSHEQTIPCRFLADTSDTVELLHELRIREYVMRVLVVYARLCFD